jgi:hypothetical protein
MDTKFLTLSMGHGNNQTRSAIPQAAWCQLNRGRIRRLLGWYQASHNLTQLIDNSMSSSKSAALESQNDSVILRSFYYSTPVRQGI